MRGFRVNSRTLLTVGLFLGTLTDPIATAHADGHGRSVVIIASAGLDRHALVGQTIQLDASGSTSASGRPLTYRWSMVKTPAGSAARLSDPTAVRPTFKVDADGDYVFSVSVRAKEGEEGPAPDSATVVVSTANVAPVADAGLDRRVRIGATWRSTAHTP